MNPRRTSMVKMAFNLLDTDKYVSQNFFSFLHFSFLSFRSPSDCSYLFQISVDLLIFLFISILNLLWCHGISKLFQHFISICLIEFCYLPLFVLLPFFLSHPFFPSSPPQLFPFFLARFLSYFFHFSFSFILFFTSFLPYFIPNNLSKFCVCGHKLFLPSNSLSSICSFSPHRSGVVTADEIAAMYDVSHNPDVISGKNSSPW